MLTTEWHTWLQFRARSANSANKDNMHTSYAWWISEERSSLATWAKVKWSVTRTRKSTKILSNPWPLCHSASNSNFHCVHWLSAARTISRSASTHVCNFDKSRRLCISESFNTCCRRVTTTHYSAVVPSASHKRANAASSSCIAACASFNQPNAWRCSSRFLNPLHRIQKTVAELSELPRRADDMFVWWSKTRHANLNAHQWRLRVMSFASASTSNGSSMELSGCYAIVSLVIAHPLWIHRVLECNKTLSGNDTWDARRWQDTSWNEIATCVTLTHLNHLSRNTTDGAGFRRVDEPTGFIDILLPIYLYRPLERHVRSHLVKTGAIDDMT